MKKWLYTVALLWSLPVVSLAGETPEDMIKLYFEAFKAGDHELMAANMHPDELAKLKKELIPVIARGIDAVEGGVSRDQLAMKLFADTDPIDVIMNESPQEFFVRFMSWVNRMNPMMKNAMAGSTIDTLGFVPEDDMAHVVYRVNINLMGARVRDMNVMSVKKLGDAWKLMLSGEVEGMGKLLQRADPAPVP